MNKALFFEMNKVKKYKTVSEICLFFFLSFLKKYKREGGIHSVKDLLGFFFLLIKTIDICWLIIIKLLLRHLECQCALDQFGGRKLLLHNYLTL